MKKFVVVVFLILLIISVLMISVEATTDSSGYNDKMGALIKSNWSDSTSASSKATTILTTIVVVLKIIAVAVAIVMLLAVAMKYMMSAPGDRAEIKKHAIPYVIGAIVLFGASGILSLIQQFSNAFNT